MVIPARTALFKPQPIKRYNQLKLRPDMEDKCHTQRAEESMAKRHMAFRSEDPLIKAESMAADMRRSRKRDLIASRREHRRL